MKSKLQIHVVSGKDDHGDYYSHAMVIAEESDPRVRSSMIHSGSQAAASMSSSHTRAMSDITTTRMIINNQNQKLIGD